MKKLKTLLLCIAFCINLCGCLPHTELDKQAIVEAVGIDFSDEGYEVTVQYFNMEGSGGNTPIDASKANVINVTGRGKNVSTALESASIKCGKNFMYGITTIVILGKEALKKDVIKTLSFAESIYQSNPNLLIAAAEKASEIMDVKFKEGVISVERLKMLLNNAEYHGLGENVKMLELLSEQRRKNAATILPLLKVSDTGTSATDDGKTVELSGGYLISDKTFKSELPLSVLSGLQLLGEKPENTAVGTDIKNEHIEVTLYDIDCKINYSYDGEKLFFGIKIQADGKYTDSQLENKDASFGGTIEKSCASVICERIEKAVGDTIIAYGCDPVGLKYVISSRNHKEWIRIEDNFGELLKNAVFDIRCDIDIDRFGISH